MKFKRMKQVNVYPGMTVDDLLISMRDGGFTCRKVALATGLLEEMILDNNCTVILGLAGALIPGGMRNIIRTMIEKDIVKCIVTTGANISHDLLETSGGSHYHGSEHLDDEKLKEIEMSRIFSTLITYESFVKFETMIQKILETMQDEKMSSRQFIFELGRHVDDPLSFVRAAFLKKVPIFSPSFSDSMLGVQSWLYSQNVPLFIDVLKDHTEFSNIIFEADRIGAMFLGGGVPKHFIMNGSQLHNGLSYAIQITMDRPEHGGVSGASVKEAVSWGKMALKGKWIDIMSDVTLVLPLMISGVLSRLSKRNG
ncbi:MAG: deoxyhypusine synthase family protein [Candidatus Heimdallarchaeota archaeon]|nr:MAG: deoxyhypusine synthase family protein [Candidatus Heimdallarchaeota archaeon]